jgi:hypothetical protein
MQLVGEGLAGLCDQVFKASKLNVDAVTVLSYLRI